ncbi:MAG: hypothetical protein MN733_41670 [Nitrososphaera sp.]|nr:hypothetical protein [Nitrososphaera sp.]
MFWKKRKRPAAPPPDQDEAFVEWLLRYGQEFDTFRKIYAANIEKYVDINKRAVLKELQDHPDHESLSQRYSAGCSLYAEGFMAAVNDSGGIRALGFQDPQLQANIAMFQIKLLIFHYVLKYKYKDRVVIHSEYITGESEELYV